MRESKGQSADGDAIHLIYPTDGERIASRNVELIGWVQATSYRGRDARMALKVNGRLYSSFNVLPQTRSPFKQQIPLENGQNEILLQLMVGMRLVEEKKVIVDVVVEEQPLSLESLYKNSWALLIGIDNSPAAQPLKYAVNDAKSLQKFLRTRTFFDKDKILTLFNEQATRKRILELMNDFLGTNPEMTSDDRVLIFFAGHGQRRRVRRGHRRSDWRGYLVPFDGDLEKIHSSCISMEEIREAASVICAKHILFVLDCCFSGLAGLRPRAAIPRKPRSQAFGDTCVRILTAGKSDEEVFEGKEGWEGNSLFSRYLLKGLEGFADHDNDGIITSDDLYFFVRDRVLEESGNRQTPQARHLVEYGEGQFVFFVRRDEQASKAEQAGKAEPVEEQVDTTKSREPVAVSVAEPVSGTVGMVLIPAGSFQMGSLDAVDESPVHAVELTAYEIDVAPVSNRMFFEFLKATGYDGRAEADDNYLADWVSGTFPAGQDNYPVTCVSWFNAAAYCLWRGCQLPTEAQWERACRGGLECKKYPWGDSLPAEITRKSRARRRKMPIGQVPPNRFGLLDISGNVSQWCQDFYDKNYYSNSPTIDPPGSESGELRVVRGGSFIAGPALLRCAVRLAADPKATSPTIGFRCVRLKGDRF